MTASGDSEASASSVFPPEVEALIERWGGPVHQGALVVALDPDGWVLSLLHPNLGWSFPGGHREPGESMMEAAARELTEETGLVADGLEPFGWTVDLSDRVTKCPGACHVTECFVYRCASSPTPSGDEADANGAAWFRMDSLPDPRSPDFASILDQLFKQRASRADMD